MTYEEIKNDISFRIFVRNFMCDDPRLYTYEDEETLVEKALEEIECVLRDSKLTLLIKFKDGRKLIYNPIEDYRRRITTENDYLSYEHTKMEYAERLKEILYLEEVSYETLANYVGVSPKTIYRFANGISVPDCIQAKLIADALGRNIEEFYYEEIDARKTYRKKLVREKYNSFNERV